jgi:hypothetical protein
MRPKLHRIFAASIDAVFPSAVTFHRVKKVYRAHMEGHACHARGIGMDDPTLRGGRDKRVPPTAKSEGHARRAR